jgi:hypothetical protein
MILGLRFNLSAPERNHVSLTLAQRSQCKAVIDLTVFVCSTDKGGCFRANHNSPLDRRQRPQQIFLLAVLLLRIPDAVMAAEPGRVISWNLRNGNAGNWSDGRAL